MIPWTDGRAGCSQRWWRGWLSDDDGGGVVVISRRCGKGVARRARFVAALQLPCIDNNASPLAGGPKYCRSSCRDSVSRIFPALMRAF